MQLQTVEQKSRQEVAALHFLPVEDLRRRTIATDSGELEGEEGVVTQLG